MLQINRLTKCFGGLTALNRLDLNIYKGEIMGLIGPNGAGKTTVFNIITGFLRPTAGKIVFEGEDITAKKPHLIAQKGIVRTFQANSIFPDFTVLENIMAGCYLKPKVGFWEAAFHLRSNRHKEEFIRSRALKIIEFMGLHSSRNMVARYLPHGHQRVLGIAIALAAEPQLLLLDEPFSGMNAEEVNNTKTLIHKIWQSGVTVLLIEHNMGAIMTLCQRIAVLNFGNKIAEGSPDEIGRNKDVIQAYLGTAEHVT